MTVEAICYNLSVAFATTPHNKKNNIPLYVVGQSIRTHVEQRSLAPENAPDIMREAAVHLIEVYDEDKSYDDVLTEIVEGYKGIDRDKEALIYLARSFFKFMDDCMKPPHCITAPSVRLTAENVPLIEKFDLLCMIDK